MAEYRQNFCPHCGSKIAEGANVCSVCGATLEAPHAAYTPPSTTPTYQQPPTPYMSRSEEEGLDAAQALVLCCFGSPATAWVVFKALGMEKKAYHSCIIFFVPMIVGFVAWILILIPLLAVLMSGLPSYYP